jgi:hypothetical protein
MPNDASHSIPQGPRPDWNLPDIVDIRIQRVQFEPPKLRNFKSALADYKEAIEFLVRTNGPIPARALSPALFIGDVRVIENQQMGENLYRFLAFEPQRLEPGTPIGWGWLDSPREQLLITKFPYEGGPEGDTEPSGKKPPEDTGPKSGDKLTQEKSQSKAPTTKPRTRSRKEGSNTSEGSLPSSVLLPNTGLAKS